MPLRDDLQRIGDRIVAHFENRSDPPFLLYQYLPKDEYVVRCDLAALRLWLQAEERGIACASISLAELFWESLEESGWLETLITQEREAGGDDGRLRRVYESVAEILTQPPTLPDRVIGRLKDHRARTAVFLYRAGALYPAYRTSALLDQLRGRVTMPVVLLYPGRLVGDFGLSFMGRAEPAYGYRAIIIPRGRDT